LAPPDPVSSNDSAFLHSTKWVRSDPKGTSHDLSGRSYTDRSGRGDR
jgi:hypothetical protein